MTLDIGSRRELFVDEALIERFAGGVALRLHQPTRREVVLICDKPWEGNMSGAFATVLHDPLLDRFRLYYKTWAIALSGKAGQGERLDVTVPLGVGLAESADGLQWERVPSGVVEHAGWEGNNLVFTGVGDTGAGVHGFAPFIDTRPGCPPEARYKAVGAQTHACGNGLYAMQSPDGVRWDLVQEAPVITQGVFDSQNLAFWDAARGQYRAYVRDLREGRRDIRTAVSDDFVHWTDPEWLDYGDALPEQLYTNMVMPCPGAPHLLVGFPARYVERSWSQTHEKLSELEHRRRRSGVVERFGAALTDGLFMASRDGVQFRRYGEAFLRPGPQGTGQWAYGDNYQAWGLIPTPSDLPAAPPEWSLFVTENYWREPGAQVRRWTLRQDGFVSVHADRAGGQVITPPLVFDGNRLTLNLSTSAAGSVRVEIQDPAGTPLPGYALKDCPAFVGDALDYVAGWKDGEDMTALAGRPVRLRFVLQDADLYALHFVGEAT